MTLRQAVCETCKKEFRTNQKGRHNCYTCSPIRKDAKPKPVGES